MTSTTSTTSTGSSTSSPVTTSGNPLQFSVRSKVLINSQTSPIYGKDGRLPSFDNGLEFKHIEYSRDGSLIAYVHNQYIVVHRTDNGAQLIRIERPNVVYVSFSPANSFLLTWERFSESNNNENNLLVWDLSNGNITFRTSQKHCNAENWPLIKWTDDEMLAGRLVQNEIHFFNGRNIGLIAKKLKLPDIQQFDFAPGDSPYKFSTFVPEKKERPGLCRIYIYPNIGEHASHISFYKANEAKVFWNRKGTNILIHTSTDTDKTGKSYYGETGLWFLSLDGTSFSLGIKGPIHDVKWSPTIDQFVVCYGNPFNTTLFNIKGTPLVDFGSLPRNTIRFSPNGKLLCLGGFGNLQGDMDFWDLTRYKKIVSTHAHCATYCEWAADSVHFLTAVLSPRIRVDNGVRVIKYDGSIVYQEQLPELYQALWRPMNPLAFPDEKIILPSPTVLKETNSPPQRYTPPSQRLAAQLAPPTPVSNLPPGFKIHIAPGAAGSAAATSSSGSSSSAPKKDKKPAATSTGKSNNSTTTTTTTTSPTPPSREYTAEEQLEKKIKNLGRKLKEIEQLKAKLELGEHLPPTAIEKVHNEPRFREELTALKQQHQQQQQQTAAQQ